MTTTVPSPSVGLAELQRRRNSSMVVVIGLVLAATSMVAFALDGLGDQETLAGLLIAPICFLAISPLALWLVRAEDRFAGLGSILVLGMGIKLTSALLRFEMVRTVYGSGDSNEYHRWAAEAQGAFRSFRWGTLDVDAPIPGTGFIRLLTAAVYSVIGVDQFGGFLVFATLSLAASMILYRAFTIGLPDGDRRLFAVFVFCWPSWIFWPSSIGKDAWMVFALSLAALGAAHVLRTFKRGYFTLFLGIAAATVVRPHIAGMIVASVAGALLVSSVYSGSSGGRSRGLRITALVLVLGAGVLVSGRIMTLFGIDELSADSVGATFDETVRLTSQGGSSFAASPVRTPLDVPLAMLTALVRPLPHEISNGAAAIASLEGLMVLSAVALRWNRIRHLPQLLLRHPFAAASMLYIVLFSVAFSAIGNFGILSRQRVQVYPFLFILLCLPEFVRTPASTPAPDANASPSLPEVSLP